MADRFTNPRQLFYTIEDTAELLKVSDRTVRRWIKAKMLPAFKVGSQVRIPRADLEAFLQARRYGLGLNVL
ncbi:DNA-binding protein [Georhizobium profundi]|uniref:DNA-binding protein n=1 Tax=Georhizobium profundi TaxID=2341112 RepID=A0A3Q8XTM4_9HYPH|nr:helix-turn-helix domain-containing protein [Georhizobium profundi]AZN73378.1 DNA-binding protein [Georhizobium profundi]